MVYRAERPAGTAATALRTRVCRDEPLGGVEAGATSSVVFAGSASVCSGELRLLLREAIRATNAAAIGFGPPSEEAWERFETSAMALYLERGFLDARVEPPRASDPLREQSGATIVTVREGPRYHLRRVAVREVATDGREVEPLGGRTALVQRTRVTAGEWPGRSRIGETIAELRRFYGDAGYGWVDISADTTLDRPRAAVDLTLSIHRGPLVHIGRIDIVGASASAESVARRAFGLTEGERYSETRRANGVRQLRALGLFEQVDLSTRLPPSRPDRIEFVIDVVERPGPSVN